MHDIALKTINSALDKMHRAFIDPDALDKGITLTASEAGLIYRAITEVYGFRHTPKP